MRKLLIAAAAIMVLGSGSARAGGPFDLVGGGGRIIDGLSGRPSAAPVRLQPVVGSVQRTGHFNNPFTHKAKYTKMVYNPLTGHFGRMKFKQ
jgi:hypothetical protein